MTPRKRGRKRSRLQKRGKVSKGKGSRRAKRGKRGPKGQKGAAAASVPQGKPTKENQLPLYESSARPAVLSGERPPGNTGLWFDKFCDTWSVRDGSWTMSSPPDGTQPSPKSAWLEQVSSRAVGEGNELSAFTERQTRLVMKEAGRLSVYETESRFVTGLGRSHPVENGFAWYPTLGTPYLPGSSVKGMVRAWAEQSGDAEADAPGGTAQEQVDRLLGGPDHAGTVVFLDAVPTEPVRLEPDVMTPHYAGWDESDPPGDWRSPTPIPFLTVAPGSRFFFGVIPRRGEEEGEGRTKDDLDAVCRWLDQALEWAGAGAKTAVGYGRFVCNTQAANDLKAAVARRDEERRQAAERKEAMKTPEGRWRIKLGDMSEGEILEEVRIHLEADPLEDARERRALAQAVPEEMLKLWLRGNKREPWGTSLGAKKLKARGRLVRKIREGS